MFPIACHVPAGCLVRGSAHFHQVATEQPLITQSIPRLIEGMGIDFAQARVSRLEPDANLVHFDDRAPLRYDQLVYALGNRTETSSVPGIAAHAFVLDGKLDRLHLRTSDADALVANAHGLLQVIHQRALITKRRRGHCCRWSTPHGEWFHSVVSVTSVSSRRSDAPSMDTDGREPCKALQSASGKTWFIST